MSSRPDLFSPARFADAIDRIARRRAGTLNAPSLEAKGVSLATIHRDRHMFARHFVRDLQRGRCPGAPGRIFWVERQGKRRRLFALPLLELIIHDAVASWLAERLAPEISPHVYSYRAGLSYHRALRAFARYVRSAVGSPQSNAERGVYVLRRDVHAYFDSIAVGDGAPLWSVVERLLGSADADDPAWILARRTLRPLLIRHSGEEYVLECGIPTGTPVANVIANAYLGGMDAGLSNVPGLFYARYGDDLVVAHTDHAAASEAARILDAHAGEQGLTFSAGKTRDVFLTTRGASSSSHGVMVPAEEIELLGHRVTARGTIRLSLAKTRALLDQLRLRATNAAVAGAMVPEIRLARAVRAVNRLLDPQGPAAHPYARLLRTTVTDRPHLKWIDYEAASIVLEAALGSRSPRHFRRFPMKLLRGRFGLVSLVRARNRAGRS